MDKKINQMEVLKWKIILQYIQQRSVPIAKW